MTPERIESIRANLARRLSADDPCPFERNCDHPECMAVQLLLAVDGQTELNALREKVASFEDYLLKERNAGSVLRLVANLSAHNRVELAFQAAVRALTNAIDHGCEIGIFEEPKP